MNVSIIDIRLILKDLFKVIKVISVYPENNPLPQSMRRSFCERLEQIVARKGDLKFQIEKDRLSIDGETAYEESSADGSLAAMFFDEGVTSLTLKAGLDYDEISRFLDVLKESVNAPAGTHHLSQDIWAAGLKSIVVTTLEDVQLSAFDNEMIVQEIVDDDSQWHQKFSSDEGGLDYKAIFDNSPIPLEPDQDEAADGGSTRIETSWIADELAPTGLFDPPAASVPDQSGVGAPMPDIQPKPDAVMILNDQARFSDDEEAHIRRLLQDDQDFDPLESTAALVKEMLHQESEMQDFYESVAIAEKIQTTLLQQGCLVEAGLLLDYIRKLRERIREDRPLWAERLRDAVVTAGSRERLKVLSETLNRNDDIEVEDLHRYLQNFDWQALSGISDLLGMLEHRSHREGLCDFLAESGEKSIDILSKGIYDKRWHVVRNSAIILGRIGSRAALKHLENASRHEEKRVRLALVQALADNPLDDTLEILKVAAADDDSEVRKEAVRSITARRGQKAFDAITDVINNDGFFQSDRDEQQQLLNAYSTLGGEHALSYLQRLAMQPNPLRSSNLTFLRQAAFEALAHNHSEKCEHLLVKLANSWRPALKNAARRAIQRRREVMYGDDDD